MTLTMVTVGGSETEQKGHAPRDMRSRGLPFVIVGLVSGLLLGALFTGSRTGETGPTGTVVGEPDASPVTVPPTTSTTEVLPSRLATMAPGMLDTLVTSAIDRNSMSVVTIWEPSGRNPTVVTLPWGDVTTDATKTWLSLGTPGRWMAGRTLWVGNTAYMEPVSSRLVGEPVWHARLPGRLAWIETTSEGWFLMSGGFVAGQTTTPRRIVSLDEGTTLVAWTDSGLVTATFDDVGMTLELRGETGEVLTTRPVGTVLGSGPNLIAISEPTGDQVLLDPMLRPAAGAPWGPDCFRVEWSPSGLAAAVHCGMGDTQRWEYWQDSLNFSEPLYSHLGQEYTDFGFATTGLPFVAWIDPLRPASTILFYHPADGQEYTVTYPGRAMWLEAIQR